MHRGTKLIGGGTVCRGLLPVAGFSQIQLHVLRVRGFFVSLVVCVRVCMCVYLIVVCGLFWCVCGLCAFVPVCSCVHVLVCDLYMWFVLVSVWSHVSECVRAECHLRCLQGEFLALSPLPHAAADAPTAGVGFTSDCPLRLSI